VVVIGADAEKGSLVYHGVRDQTASEVIKLYEDAGRYCSPPQAVTAIAIPLARGETLVAVNVDPSPDHLVAAPIARADGVGRPRVEEVAWVFPIRVATQTIRPATEADGEAACVPPAEAGGLVAWLLASPRRIAPAPVCGVLGLFEVELA
jgi:hypothetical protein